MNFEPRLGILKHAQYRYRRCQWLRGAELAALVQNHPELKLFGLYVSAGSQDAHKRFSSLHPQWVGELDQPLLPLDEDGMT